MFSSFFIIYLFFIFIIFLFIIFLFVSFNWRFFFFKNLEFFFSLFVISLFIFLISFFYDANSNYIYFSSLSEFCLYFSSDFNSESSQLFKSAIFSDIKLISFPFVYAFILITILTIVFCFSYNQTELLTFLIFSFFILTSGLLLFLTNSLLIFFFVYEMLLLPSFFILYKYAKTRKAVEAAFLMFFWTQFGAIFLIFNFQYLFFITNSFKFSDFKNIPFTQFEINFLFITALIGFGVKFPIWPFYDWLPKAHVEASTNFSIFLSGVLVKFAFFGFFKYILSLGIDFSVSYIYPFLIIGIIDSSLKLFYQLDLKKAIAYSTVVEMHWLLIALISGLNVFWIAASAMLLSHAILSSALFFSIDFVTRRFKTRLTTEISGIYYLVPDLYTLTLTILIIFLGFPGTLFFLAEFIFFTFLSDLNFFVFILIFIFIYLILPISFIKNWFLLLFSYNLPIINFKSKEVLLDINFFEKSILTFFIIQLFWLGFTFQFLFL